MKNTKELDALYIANTYKRFDIQIDSESCGVSHSEDKNYIDFGTGIGVNIFGSGDQMWIDAVCNQASTLPHASNLYYTKPCVDLAELLCTKTSMKKVFFANSGAEANECAIKCARKYSSDTYGEDRKTIITLVNSFHGRTLLTLSATGQDVFHKHFGPFVDGFKYVPANDIEALKEALTDDVCGFMFECIQGEGGIIPLDKEYLKEAAQLCRAKDVLLIADEVQAGNGRTGYLYSYMAFGISPDIVSTAKGLGGGLPIGACLMGEAVQNTLDAGSHGSTFGGNPIACAGAKTIISRLDEEFLSDVRSRAKYLWDKLSEIKEIKKVSGLGFMIGLEVDNAPEIISKCATLGLLVLSSKAKIRLLPPINVSQQTIDSAVEILRSAIADVSK